MRNASSSVTCRKRLALALGLVGILIANACKPSSSVNSLDIETVPAPEALAPYVTPVLRPEAGQTLVLAGPERLYSRAPLIRAQGIRLSGGDATTLHIGRPALATVLLGPSDTAVVWSDTSAARAWNTLGLPHVAPYPLTAEGITEFFVFSGAVHEDQLILSTDQWDREQFQSRLIEMVDRSLLIPPKTIAEGEQVRVEFLVFRLRGLYRVVVQIHTDGSLNASTARVARSVFAP